MAEDPEDRVVINRLIQSVKEISGLPECRGICKNMHGNLARRIKLLSPLFEELKDSNKGLGHEEKKWFEMLNVAFDSAKGLLKSVNEGSKLYQVVFPFQVAVEVKKVVNFRHISSSIFCIPLGVPLELRTEFLLRVIMWSPCFSVFVHEFERENWKIH